jgi:hypothetical protein
MSSDAFIQCRVTSELKGAISRLAHSENLSESALVRQLLETLVRSSISQPTIPLEVAEAPHRDSRISVRLSPEDRLLVIARAAARGIAPATYISVLTRAHLRQIVALPKDELVTLKRLIGELSALGRNVNQLARVASISGKVQGDPHEVFLATLRIAQGLRDWVKALLKANTESWRIGHAP